MPNLPQDKETGYFVVLFPGSQLSPQEKSRTASWLLRILNNG
jgi:hypothetical protein